MAQMRAKPLRPLGALQMYRRHVAGIARAVIRHRNKPAGLHRENIAVALHGRPPAYMANMPCHAQAVAVDMQGRKFRRPRTRVLSLHHIHMSRKIIRYCDVERLLAGPGDRPRHVFADHPGINHRYSNEAAMLTDKARITVLNKNPIKPCKVARRRNFFEVTLQSET